MKKSLMYVINILMVYGCLIVSSCSGSDDPETPDDPNDDKVTSGIELIVDKATLEANGKDVVTFTVKDNNGEDVTSSSYIRNEVSDKYIGRKGANTFSYMENGQFTFKARYEKDGKEYFSESVTVTSQNRKKYEFYRRKVAVFKMTGTWCVNCPGMTKALETASEKIPNRIVEMALHASTTESADPFHLSATAEFATAMGGLSGFPTAVYDLRKSTASSNTSFSVIEENIETSMKDYPATCGIKISSKYDAANSTIKVNASLKSSVGGSYELAYVLVADGLIAPQTGADDKYVHNNTVLAVSGNFLGGATKFTLGSGEEHKANEFTIQNAKNLDPAKTRVIVYAIVKDGSAQIINNIAECGINSSVDYIENAN